jgi:hypothetical protein
VLCGNFTNQHTTNESLFPSEQTTDDDFGTMSKHPGDGQAKLKMQPCTKNVLTLIKHVLFGHLRTNQGNVHARLRLSTAFNQFEISTAIVGMPSF